VKKLLVSIWSPGIWRADYLAKFFGTAPRFAWRKIPADAIWIGWGYKSSGLRAQQLATRSGTEYWLIEDGFLRSVELTESPLSIVIDDCGIYYDAHRPSRLEKIIPRQLNQKEIGRAQQIRKMWCAGYVSKYNYQRNFTGDLPPSFVLVIDQTRRDASIIYGQANDNSFEIMLNAALQENPHSPIVIKIHPAVIAKRKSGHFDLKTLARNPRLLVLTEDAHPANLLERADKVYVVTSQIGFEALLWNKPVRVFGMPFYAGWGLTEDLLPPPPRRKNILLEQLIYATLITYPRYLDPESGNNCEIERILEYFSLQRQMRERFPKKVYAHGFSTWKRPIVQDFCQGSVVHFVNSVNIIPPHETLLLWGKKSVIGNLDPEINILRLEDGFIRSVGLGADLIRPLSWVIDPRGIYYDAHKISMLEQILEYHQFTPEIIERARILRERIVANGLTKYNLVGPRWNKPESVRSIILVPGQVESDASIKYGAHKINTNMDLLRLVRAEHPHAYLIYKPHPDVIARLRQSSQNENQARQWCDEIIIDTPINQLLDVIDEVHVITSLTGFEALLRGKKVVTYGLPFYAGWGLTNDIENIQRRTRRLTIDELVAGALILYPTYVSRVTKRFTTAERALEELLEWRKLRKEIDWWRKPFRLILGLFDQWRE